MLDTENLSSSSSIRSVRSIPIDCSSTRFAAAESRRAAPHATFAPMHYEPNYAYPLLVWLHGYASNEHELRQVMPQVSMRNYVAVAREAPCERASHRGNATAGGKPAT